MEAFTDITDSKDLEHIIHSSKLEAIGSLATGIAHEINTPIQFISNNTVFFQDAFNKIATILNRFLHLLDMNKAGSVTPELLNELDVMARDIQLEYLVEEIPVALILLLDIFLLDKLTKFERKIPQRFF